MLKKSIFSKGKHSRTKRKLESNYKNISFILISLLILIAIGIGTVIYINKGNNSLWGAEVYAYLNKGNKLYESIVNGNWFINYDTSLYNGIQPFRYWAPIPYYLIAVINIFIKDIYTSFNIMIILLIAFGGMGVVLLGKSIKRPILGLVFGCLWFFIPYNLHVVFIQGNISLAVANIMIPYIILYYYRSLNYEEITTYIKLAIFMMIIALCNPIIACMVFISLAVFSLVYYLFNKSLKKNLIALLVSFLGVMLSGFWLIPFIKGNGLLLDKFAAHESIKMQAFSILESINPFSRLDDPTIYYFGFSFFIMTVFGIMFSKKKENQGFIIALIILLGTSTFFIPLFSDTSINQIFWISRYTPIAIVMIFLSLLLWRKLRKSILVTLIIIMVVDSMVSFNVLNSNRRVEEYNSTALQAAMDVSDGKIATFDSSSLEGDPKNHIYDLGRYRNINQVVGGLWQGITTSKNIIEINNALDNEFFALMFDRLLELGLDTVSIEKKNIKDLKELEAWANKVGYEKRYEDYFYVVYKIDTPQSYGSKVQYDGLGIGQYAPNISNIFPNIRIGKSEYIDDYSIDELSSYKSIFLSGFKYRNKSQLESLIKELSVRGVNVVIDVQGQDEELLGVSFQPIIMLNDYGDVYYKGELLDLVSFPSGMTEFMCSFLSTSNSIEDTYAIVEKKKLEYFYSIDENIKFLGFNLAYYTYETKNNAATKVLEDALEMESYVLPKREIIEVDTKLNKDTITLTSESEGVLLPIADIDSFHAEKGSFSNINNLVKINDKEVVLKITTPYFKTGVLISILSALGVVGICSFVKHKERSQRRKRRNRRRRAR